MNEAKVVAFNLAILEGNLDVCKESIREGLSLKSMMDEVKKSPIRDVQLLLNFAADRRRDGFSNEEIYSLIADCSPDRLSNYEIVGVAGMKQVLKEKEQRVKRFRRNPL